VSRRSWLRVLLATPFLGIAMLVGAVALIFMSFMGTAEQNGGSVSLGACLTSVDTGAGRSQLDGEQMRNAATITTVGRRLGVPPRGLVVAIATAQQESGLRNLNYGDRDSVGLFQQRPSAGWGTPAELTDPPTAAAKFYQALLQVPGWESMPVTQAAQMVQRSAFPFAYARWESLAVTLVGAPNGGADCVSLVAASLPRGAIGDFLRAGLAQQGKPYVWGATGPDAFDCSGLVVYAWRQAGYSLRVRTADQMYRVSAPVAPGTERPGDLIFGEFGTRVTGAGHVMIVVRPGLALEAPRTGLDVRLRPYDLTSGDWKVGRLSARAFSRLPKAA
jgi:peptidoglycan DL-endopeptidase CwlO